LKPMLLRAAETAITMSLFMVFLGSLRRLVGRLPPSTRQARLR